MKRILLLVLLFFMSVNLVFANNYDGKFIARKKLEDFNFRFETEYRKKENKLNRRHYDFGLEVPLKNDWLVSINYRSIYRHRDDNWQLEKRRYVQISKAFKSEFLKLTLRTRQEFRQRKENENSWRNRSRIMLKSRKEILKLKPFASNEFFYDFKEDKYNKNRISIGADLPKFSNFKPAIYYKIDSNLDENSGRHKSWKSDYSVVFKLSVDF